MNQQPPAHGYPQQIQQSPQQQVVQQPPSPPAPIPGVTVVTGNSELIPQFLVVSREKEGKCLSGSTLVTLPNGRRISIREIVAGAHWGAVLSMGHGGLISDGVVVTRFKPSMKQLFRLTTQTGRVIDASAEHKFFTQRGWVELQNLKPDEDRVFIVAEYPREMFWHGKTRPANVAGLLAYCIADGYLEPALKFTKNDDEVRDDFISMLVEMGDNYRVEERSDGHATTVIVAGGQSSKLVQLVDSFGLLNKRSGDKFIPDEVFTWSRIAVSTFLNRLFTCDGSVEARGAVSYSSKSIQLVRDVQSLLARFGIIGRIKDRFRLDKLYGAELIIQSRANIIAFADFIGMFGEKGRKLAAMRADLASRPSEGTETQMWRHGPYLLDRIASVGQAATEEAFDIEVAEHHNFIANDFVVHNSATVGTTLVNYPHPGMHPLFFAYDENGPNSCLKLGYQPHVMVVKRMQGLRWIDKTRDGLTRLENNIAQVRALYGSIVVDCASTMVDNFHEDARRDPQNPDGRSHFGAALLHSKETMHRLARLGLPIWWLAWLREPETVEEKIGNDAKTVKVKRLIPGGANILGSFKAILPGKAQHIFILEKKNVGPHQYADETGHVRIFHTRDHANIRAGGRFSHLLPPEVPAHCGQIMRIIMGDGTR